MRKLFYAGTALCTLAGIGTLTSVSQSHAADLPSRTTAPAPAPYFAAPPVFTWTGFYLGVNAGYNFGKVTSLGTRFGTTDGASVGGTAGYNYQINQLVFGVEGDLDWVGARRTLNFVGPVTTKASLKSLGTLRGRVGYAADRALLYVTGGYAGGTLDTSIVDTPAGTASTSNAYRSGFALGGGIEYALTNQVSAKAEYLYTGLQKKTVFTVPDTTTAGYGDLSIRFGLNYHF